MKIDRTLIGNYYSAWILPCLFWSIFLGTVVAVDFLKERSVSEYVFRARYANAIFTVGVMAYTCLPFFVGIFWKSVLPSKITILMLLALCFATYAVTDPLPLEYENFRDAVFLTSSGTAIFIGAVWTRVYIRTRQWMEVAAASLGIAILMFGTLFTIGMFMFME